MILQSCIINSNKDTLIGNTNKNKYINEYYYLEYKITKNNKTQQRTIHN